MKYIRLHGRRHSDQGEELSDRFRLMPGSDAAPEALPHPQLNMQLLPPTQSFSQIHMQAHSLALALAEAAQMQQAVHLQPMQLQPQLVQPALVQPAAPEEEAVPEGAAQQLQLQDAEQQVPKKRRRKPLPMKAKLAAHEDNSAGRDDAGGGVVCRLCITFPTCEPLRHCCCMCCRPGWQRRTRPGLPQAWRVFR